MKNNIVKGFTLIELILVIATFSIVMFGAMQLMQPTRALFDRSYQAEDVSAAEKNIREYLEGTLRYAEFIQIDELDPTVAGCEITGNHAQIPAQVWNAAARPFVEARYNGWVLEDGVTPGTGTVHVMYINNLNGGQISDFEYGFTACNVDPTGTGTRPTAYTSSSIKEWAVNKAFYDRYHYMISLGVTIPNGTDMTIDGETIKMYEPVQDSSYYSNFNNVNYQKVCQDNFSMTINAYDTNPRHAKTAVVGGRTLYSQLTTMTANMAFVNIQDGREIYVHRNWQDDPVHTGSYIHPEIAPGTMKFCNCMEAGCKLMDPNNLSNSVASVPQFKLDATGFHPDHYNEPKVIRIIYTYPQV